ncbi:MAG: beta-galactosidase [Caldicoprobacterales bacterium]|jgi:hypothetical protein|nr:beta-galactosidase [Clostridiales bacterium]
MVNYLDLTNHKEKKIIPLSDKFRGKDPHGNEISFTNYYMELNGQPFFGISGECHFSRVHEDQWEDTILKMKMGGLNIVSTYCFWNHHEEEEGVFNFEGSRNIRKFIQLCHKHGMYVIVRIGPFCHGEVRNGGLPDWLYGKPFEVRSLDPGFLDYTRRLYREYAQQFEGLYYKYGGPIIAAQIENEYMHSAAPWEMTTGVSNEWVSGGRDGNEYMIKLKQIAREEGIITPFYTCTAWGGAATPTEEMLPLWGGYAFWPWIFYNYEGEHPATPEYIYRDNHNNQVPKTYNFEPPYPPESMPYACCEMGGGMTCFYNYRFQLPYESVDAMANIKLGSGCNFLGYYMYRGGSNPKGSKVPYLNEHQCPKISYDYQAAIGEHGQLRPSYYRLKALHIFLKNFGDKFCLTTTRLPEGSQDIDPEDVDTLRFAVRTDGKSGYLFLNNYQDHVECKPKENEKVVLKLSDGEIEIPGISMAAGEEAILPFNMDIEGYRLVYAKAQLLSVIREGKRPVYFFFMPEGMVPEYVWDGTGIESIGGNTVSESQISIRPDANKMSSFVIKGEKGEVEIVTLTREQSLFFYEIDIKGQKTAVLCNSPLTYDGSKIRVENRSQNDEKVKLLMYPAHAIEYIDDHGIGKEVEEGIWKGIEFEWTEGENQMKTLPVKEVGRFRYTVEIPKGYEDCKQVLLQVDYTGDIGSAFVDGELISDNFYNGAVWEIGLKDVWNLNMGREITFVITPIKEDVRIDVSSTMAGRMEKGEGAIAELRSVKLKPVYEAVFEVDR